MQTYQDLICWQKAHEFALLAYQLTENFPRQERYNLIDQIRRSVLSVPSNIVEGYRRNSKQEKLHFYNIAQASLEEARYQLLFSRDLKIIRLEDYKSVESRAEETSKVLNAWIRAQSAPVNKLISS